MAPPATTLLPPVIAPASLGYGTGSTYPDMGMMLSADGQQYAGIGGHTIEPRRIGGKLFAMCFFKIILIYRRITGLAHEVIRQL